MDLGEVFLDICETAEIDYRKMQAVDLMELEMGRYRWAEMACACGRTAAHLPEDLRRMMRATEKPPYGLFVDDHFWYCEALYEPALAAV